MSHYAQYLAEKTGDKIIENQSGFATYRYINNGKSVYIVDIYIVPDERRRMKATLFADLIAREAKENGAKEMLGTVVPSMKNSTVSLSVLLAYGFKLASASNDMIVFSKEL
jgi:hypothetical protein